MPEPEEDQAQAPYGSGDPRDWAAYWIQMLAEYPNIATDEGTMIGWFANVMQAAIDALPPVTRENHEWPPDQDFVVLPREGLFEMLGEMALPPWIDTDGSLIGSSIDCAPIVERLTTWVRKNDLSDLYLNLPLGARP